MLLGSVPWAGCTRSSAPPSPAPEPPAGRIVAFTQNPDGPALVRFEVSTQTVGPAGTAARDPAAFASAPATAGGLTAVVVSTRGVATAIRMPGGSEAQTVGPPLRVSDAGPFVSVGVVGNLALVADCDRVSVLDLSSPTSWRHVGSGCWAALSPDGSSVVSSPDGRRVVLSRVTDGSATPLLDVRRIADLGTGEWPRLFGAPSWGPGGLAFTVTAGGQAAVFLRRPDGTVVPLLQERLLKTSRAPLIAWQPGGGRLAMMDDLGTGGVLRVFDVAAGQERVVALDALGFDGLLWSPDGSSLATLTSAGALLVVGTDGEWRSRVETTWNAMLAWTA